MMDMRNRSVGNALPPLSLHGTHDEDYTWLLEVTTVGIVVTDSEGHIRLVNTEAARLFGYAREELLGQPVETLIPERYREAHVRHRAAYRHMPRARAMGAGLQLYGVRHDGSEFPMEIGLTPLHTDQGFLVATTII
ncbi:PAS domain S-box protein, partial [Arthrospira platensis SPKY2]